MRTATSSMSSMRATATRRSHPGSATRRSDLQPHARPPRRIPLLPHADHVSSIDRHHLLDACYAPLEMINIFHLRSIYNNMAITLLLL